MAIMTAGEHRFAEIIQQFPSVPEPPFEAPDEQIAAWGRPWGCDSDVGRLRVALMHRPGDELATVDVTKPLPAGGYGDPEQGWYWFGLTPPDPDAMRAQHDHLAAVLEEEGVEILRTDGCRPHLMKSMFVRDAVFAVPGGAIVCRPGPRVRRGEELAVTRALGKAGVPILRTIHGAAIMEGGSFAWLNAKTAAIGLSSRVNEAAAQQIEEVLRHIGVRLIRVQCAGYRLHLDAGFVMIGPDAAIVNQNITPYGFLEELRALGIRTVQVAPDDPPDAANCLALRPDRLIVSAGVTDGTAERIERLGISVRRLDYGKVWAGGGGVHCSVAPLLRDAV